MKIRNIALAALAVACGQAFALSPTASVADTTVQVYMSGATAMRNIIGGLFTEHCKAGTLDVYYSAIGSFSGFAFTANGDAHRVYTCTMTATSPILAGKDVAFYKSDIGGSGQGVFPVYARTQRGFLNLATCGTRAASVPNYVCTGEQQQVPMAGVSDVEPAMFKGINVPKDDPSYPADGLTDEQIGELSVKSLYQTVFGVAVNNALRNAMQTAQGLSPVGDAGPTPTISRALAASYFNGGLSDPSASLGWQPLVASGDAKKATRVNICRRVDGSGTQASANAQFLQFPCNSSPLTVADQGFSDAGLTQAVTSVGTSGKIFVYEGSSTGNVISCLGAAEDNGAYAIGHVSKENDQAGAKWKHVKLDGVEPSLANTKAGLYDYYFESTMQWSNAQYDTLSGDQQSFLDNFAAEARKPTSLAKLSTATQNGVAALPDAYAGAYGTGTTEEIKFGSRVSRGGNSCTPSTYYK
jgi:hypothetical protein